MKTPHEKAAIQRQASGSSEHWWASHQWHPQRQIDRLVYELYKLTDEEIAIVEEATE